jgi:hypothetical protein
MTISLTALELINNSLEKFIIDNFIPKHFSFRSLFSELRS